MLKKLRLRNNAILVLAVMAFILLSGCSYSKTTQDEVSPGVVPDQPQEQSDTDQIIEAKLDAIVRGSQANQLSSNPYDYIIGNQDYDDIVRMGDEAFRYMLKKMQTSQEDGLKEYIMANACAAWTGEDPRNRKWSSGQEWFEGFVLQSNEVRSGGSKQEVVEFDHISSRFI